MYAYANVGATKNLPRQVETLGKVGRLVKSSLVAEPLLLHTAFPQMEVAYWRAGHQKHVQIYRVGARAWADGPVWGLHLRNHLRGTYGKFLEFPEPQGTGSNRPPGRGAERTRGIQTGIGMMDEFLGIFA